MARPAERPFGPALCVRPAALLLARVALLPSFAAPCGTNAQGRQDGQFISPQALTQAELGEAHMISRLMNGGADELRGRQRGRRVRRSRVGGCGTSQRCGRTTGPAGIHRTAPRPSSATHWHGSDDRLGARSGTRDDRCRTRAASCRCLRSSSRHDRFRRLACAGARERRRVANAWKRRTDPRPASPHRRRTMRTPLRTGVSAEARGVRPALDRCRTPLLFIDAPHVRDTWALGAPGSFRRRPGRTR